MAAPRAGDSSLVRLSCVDDDAQGQPLEVLWERELDREVVTGESWDAIAKRQFDRPNLFAAYLNTLRWNCVTSTDPRLFQSPFRAGIHSDKVPDFHGVESFCDADCAGWLEYKGGEKCQEFHGFLLLTLSEWTSGLSPSRPLKKGTGSEPHCGFLGRFALLRGACPLFQHAASPAEHPRDYSPHAR